MVSPTTIAPAETRTHVEHVRWETYVALADDRVGSLPRATYDRGVMELMSPRKEHESISHLLGRLIEIFTEFRNIEIVGLASTTFRRPDLRQGFEADQAYYIQHAEAVRQKDEIDLMVDPPPDLVIEVELTSSVIHKLELFASMGVPELWRHDAQQLRLFQLQGSIHVQTPSSKVLPGFPLALAQSILQRRRSQGETALIREFRAALKT